MKTRKFNYGGLEIELLQSKQYGRVTTTGILCQALGVNRSTLTMVIAKYNMEEEGLIVYEEELVANLHQTLGGRNDRALWTAKLLKKLNGPQVAQ